MPSDDVATVALALLALLATLVTLALCGLLGAGAWYLVQLGRDRRMAAEEAYRPPDRPPRPAPPRKPPEDLQEDISEAELLAILDHASNGAQHDTALWAEQKREEGWSDEQIQRTLESRPTLELN